MFVILSVHTKNPVLERQASIVSKSKIYHEINTSITLLSAKLLLAIQSNNLKRNRQNPKLDSFKINISTNINKFVGTHIKISPEHSSPASIGNGTKLSAISSILPNKLLLIQQKTYKIPPRAQVPENLNYTFYTRYLKIIILFIDDKVSVATVLNKLSSFSTSVKVKKIEIKNNLMSSMTQNNMPDIKAMR